MSDISNESYFSSVSESSDDDNLNVSASERMSKEADEVNLLKTIVQFNDYLVSINFLDDFSDSFWTIIELS